MGIFAKTKKKTPEWMSFLKYRNITFRYFFYLVKFTAFLSCASVPVQTNFDRKEDLENEQEKIIDELYFQYDSSQF
jgi:hypothetical protein